MATDFKLDSTILENHTSTMTPEKLAIMKLNANLERDVFSEAGSPTHEGRFNFETHTEGGGQSRSLARSGRYASSSTRRQTSFISSHRNKMSSDLTSQAESKFYALMEFMTSASREAENLKEYWTRLMEERESFSREREELLQEVNEVSETLERNQSQQNHRNRELGERKKEYELIAAQLTAAIDSHSADKRKLVERDAELDRARTDLHDLRLSISRIQLDYDKVKSEFDSNDNRVRILEDERNHARDDAEKYRGEVRMLNREQTDLKSKIVEITGHLDSSRKEVASLVDRIRAWEREREEYLAEKDRLQDDLRKITHRADDYQREIVDITDRHDRLQREVTKLKETIRTTESERDEHYVTIERLRHEIKTKTTTAEDADVQYTELNLKYEKAKREVVTAQDRVREIEHELSDVRISLERKTEDYRSIVLERDQYRDEVDDERRKNSEHGHSHSSLKDQLSRSETHLSEVRIEVQTLHERIAAITRERDDARDKHHPLNGEITELKEQLSALHIELRTITADRDRARKELHDFKRKYEEVTETITDYQSGSGELEFEIESLRTLLREAREQKERAISQRTAADRERDEYVTKYEEKCRELERFEESRAQWHREHSHSAGRTTSTRVVTRSSNMESSSQGHSHSHGHSEQVDGE